jgi:hypothetical protein
MAQAEQHLPSKCKALSSNSSTTKIKNKKKLKYQKQLVLVPMNETTSDHLTVTPSPAKKSTY